MKIKKISKVGNAVMVGLQIWVTVALVSSFIIGLIGLLKAVNLV